MKTTNLPSWLPELVTLAFARKGEVPVVPLLESLWPTHSFNFSNDDVRDSDAELLNGEEIIETSIGLLIATPRNIVTEDVRDEIMVRNKKRWLKLAKPFVGHPKNLPGLSGRVIARDTMGRGLLVQGVQQFVVSLDGFVITPAGCMVNEMRNGKVTPAKPKKQSKADTAWDEMMKKLGAVEL